MSKHILFVGDLSSEHSRGLQRFNTFVELGYKVDGITLNKVGESLNWIQRIRYYVGYPIDVHSANTRIKEFASSTICPDILWIEKGLVIRPSTLRFVRKHCPHTRIVLYSNDNYSKHHNRSRYMRANFKEVDVVFAVVGYSEDDLRRMGAQRVVFFHRGYDRNFIKPRVSGMPFDYDVIFVGTYETERAAMLESLATQGIHVTVWGNGWHWHRRALQSSAYLHIQYKPLLGKEFVDTLHRARIVLNFLRAKNDDTTTGRTFEIPASGAFMLAQRSQQQLEYFNEGEEAEFFETREELIQKVNYYLSHPQQRETIAQNGLRRCQESGYDFHTRLQEMLTCLW
jgi:glycosyltransferase involved in cell wall biosynthesis